MRTMIAFGLCLCLAAPTLVAAQTPTPIAEAGVARIVMRDAYAVGEVPDLRVEGLTPGESVGFHLFRQMTRWVSDGAGGWKPEPTLMHGWALYTADASGVVLCGHGDPERGHEPGGGPQDAVLVRASERRSPDRRSELCRREPDAR